MKIQPGDIIRKTKIDTSKVRYMKVWKVRPKYGPTGSSFTKVLYEGMLIGSKIDAIVPITFGANEKIAKVLDAKLAKNFKSDKELLTYLRLTDIKQ